jgi:hypothetical protein
MVWPVTVLPIAKPENVKEGTSSVRVLPIVPRAAITEFRRATSPGMIPKIRIAITRTSSVEMTDPRSSAHNRRSMLVIAESLDGGKGAQTVKYVGDEPEEPPQLERSTG